MGSISPILYTTWTSLISIELDVSNSAVYRISNFVARKMRLSWLFVNDLRHWHRTTCLRFHRLTDPACVRWKVFSLDGFNLQNYYPETPANGCPPFL